MIADNPRDAAETAPAEAGGDAATGVADAPSDAASPESAAAKTKLGPLIEGVDVYRTFRLGETPVEVLKGVSLEIHEREILIVLGASGAGKSTLLHILGLLDTPTDGRVMYRERDKDGRPPVDLASLNVELQSDIRNRDFGFIFQMFHLLPEFTALENVLMPAMIRYGPLGYFLGGRRAVIERAKTLLDRVGLSHRTKHRPSQLSGGERQRVAIARALINEPKIVFCDEPTGNLDSLTARSTFDLLRELNNDMNQTFMIVTHNEVLAQDGSRQLWMHDGYLYDTGDAYREARARAGL